MHYVYCSECGTRIQVFRKAMPKYNRIIEIIHPHECAEEVIEPDFTPDPVPTFLSNPQGKFVRKLNELQPKSDIGPLAEGSGDRRLGEHTRKELTTIAPQNLLEKLKSDREDKE